MKLSSLTILGPVVLVLSFAAQNPSTVSPALAKRAAVTLAELAKMKSSGVSAAEVSDCVLGDFQGDFLGSPQQGIGPRSVLFLDRHRG